MGLWNGDSSVYWTYTMLVLHVYRILVVVFVFCQEEGGIIR